MHPLLNIAIQAVRNASHCIIPFLERLDTVDVSVKNPNDFVTQVDILSEETIVQTIRKAYPDHRILAEESGLQENKTDYQWIIDPLDGTTNFIHGFPQFSISIAVQYRDKLEIAVIYDPLRQELFTAVRGSGSQLNNRRIRVSSCSEIRDALIGTGFPYKEKESLESYLQMFKSVFLQVADIRRAGGAALDLAYVAAGRLDGFWEMSLKPWDIAAGALLVTEAGGFLSDFQGEEGYMQSGNILAGNRKLHPWLLNAISKIK